MNPFPSRRGTKGFTLVELLVVIAIIGILAAMLLPVLSKGKARGEQAFCENNLSQMGIGFHIFGHDHNSKFPMAVSTNEGGAMEFVQSGYQAGDVFYFGFHIFQTLSNELVRPQILICPADLERTASSNFPDLQNQNISYFFGANADFLNANSILAGDRNLATNSISEKTILQVGGGSAVRWTRELHQYKANVLFADGHVEEWNKPKLKSAADNLSPPADLFMPSVAPKSSNSNPNYGGNGNSGNGGGAQSQMNNLNLGSNGSGANSNNSPPSMPPPTASTANAANAAPNSTGAKPKPPPPNASGNSSGLNRNSSASGSENERLVKQIAPVQTNAQNHPALASDDSQPAMSSVDQKIAKTLRGTFEWGYFLLLLLLLLYLAYKLWQILRRDEQRRRRNQNQLPPQP